MSTAAPQSSYNDIAVRYDQIDALPLMQLCGELVALALGDCTGEVILDLGGGTGTHARTAVARGAARVDNVDLSTDMLRLSDDHETRAGRRPGERVAAIHGDATSPPEKLGLKGRDGSGLYDKTLVIWTMDHAYGPELEAMWRNVAQHTRPGGKFIGVRATDPLKYDPKVSKYGISLTRIEATPEGASLDYTPHDMQGRPMFSAASTFMKSHYDLDQARAMARSFGFSNLEVVSFKETDLVKGDGVYWQDLIDHPHLVCVHATKEA